MRHRFCRMKKKSFTLCRLWCQRCWAKRIDSSSWPFHNHSNWNDGMHTFGYGKIQWLACWTKSVYQHIWQLNWVVNTSIVISFDDSDSDRCENLGSLRTWIIIRKHVRSSIQRNNKRVRNARHAEQYFGISLPAATPPTFFLLRWWRDWCTASLTFFWPCRTPTDQQQEAVKNHSRHITRKKEKSLWSQKGRETT